MAQEVASPDGPVTRIAVAPETVASMSERRICGASLDAVQMGGPEECCACGVVSSIIFGSKQRSLRERDCLGRG
jgi:hypothetical protein